MIDASVHKTQALILAPTRELAQQIQKVVKALGDYLKVTSHAWYKQHIYSSDACSLARCQL